MERERKNSSDEPSDPERAPQSPDDRANPPRERIAPVEPAQYVQPVTTEPVPGAATGCAWWLWILILIIVILIIWGGWWGGYWRSGPGYNVAPVNPNNTPNQSVAPDRSNTGNGNVTPNPYPNSAAPAQPTPDGQPASP